MPTISIDIHFPSVCFLHEIHKKKRHDRITQKAKAKIRCTIVLSLAPCCWQKKPDQDLEFSVKQFEIWLNMSLECMLQNSRGRSEYTPPLPNWVKASSSESPSSAYGYWYCRSDVCSRAHPAGEESPHGHYRGFAPGQQQQLAAPHASPLLFTLEAPPLHSLRPSLVPATPPHKILIIILMIIKRVNPPPPPGRSNRGRKTYI